MSDGSSTSGTRTDGPGEKPTPKGTSKSASTSTPKARPSASRPPVLQRAQERVAEAAREHKRNAEARKQEAVSPSKPPQRTPRAPRRARLRLTRIDPWSVMKTSFLLSIAFGVVTVVAVAMIWSVLDAAGVWDSINATIQESVGGPDTANLDVENYVGTARVLGFTMIVAAVDVLLITAIATLSAFLYNMSAALLGGVEVTLAEDQD